MQPYSLSSSELWARASTAFLHSYGGGQAFSMVCFRSAKRHDAWVSDAGLTAPLYRSNGTQFVVHETDEPDGIVALLEAEPPAGHEG